MIELIDKWEVVSKLITLQNNYMFFKDEWDAERLCREISKLEIGIGKTPGIEMVRCKDCTEWDERNQECGHWYGFHADDFCSYGERKAE